VAAPRDAQVQSSYLASIMEEIQGLWNHLHCTALVGQEVGRWRW
jgi:hypothetical protein